MDKRRYAAALCGALLAGCLSGCGPSAEVRDSGPALTAARERTVTAEGAHAVTAADAPEDTAGFLECAGTDPALFQPYEPFGLSYDAEEDELWFDGRLVRWFEDYYPLPGSGGGQAGCDFFNENGVVDVHAVRDRSHLVRSGDGSYDPSGTLTGVEAFSEEAFASRDIQALLDPAPPTAVAGGGALSPEELEAIAAGYAPFGVTYDAGEDQWYYNGEAVCFFRDVLTSNGESLTGGGFRGTMRTLPSEKGDVRIETVRDFAHPDPLGYGTLTGIRVLEGP